jgi:hypothetical protein
LLLISDLWQVKSKVKNIIEVKILMRKIKDRIILGTITGIISSAPLQIIDALIYRHGITDLPFVYLASKIFLTKKKTKTTAGKAISSLVNFANSSFISTTITYMLSLTGKDRALIKGAGFGILMWIFIAGLLSNLGLNIKSRRPVTPLIYLGEHIVFGALCSYFITKLGDNSLFPNDNIRKRTKVPVIYSGNTGEN